MRYEAEFFAQGYDALPLAAAAAAEVLAGAEIAEPIVIRHIYIYIYIERER